MYWAFVLAVLGLTYTAFASLWPTIFNRDVVEHSIREENGYRIGWIVHWQLPRRAILPVVLISGTPIVAVTFMEGWLVKVILVVVAGMMVSLWLIASPGMKLYYAAQSQDESSPVKMIQRSESIVRSLSVFVVFGLLPALAISSLLNWLLEPFIIR